MLLLHGCWYFDELDDFVLTIVQRSATTCGELGCDRRVTGKRLRVRVVGVTRVSEHVVCENVRHGERIVQDDEEDAGELGGSVRGGMIFNWLVRMKERDLPRPIRANISCSWAPK